MGRHSNRHGNGVKGRREKISGRIRTNRRISITTGEVLEVLGAASPNDFQFSCCFVVSNCWGKSELTSRWMERLTASAVMHDMQTEECMSDGLEGVLMRLRDW